MKYIGTTECCKSTTSLFLFSFIWNYYYLMLSFQDPPRLIVENILRYCTTGYYWGYKNTLRSLSMACRSWMFATKPLLYQEYEVNIPSDTIDVPPLSLVHCFKTVRINLNFPITDTILDNIKPIQNFVFSNASYLRVDIDRFSANKDLSQEETRQLSINGFLFIEFLQKMAPNISGFGYVEHESVISVGSQIEQRYQNLFDQWFIPIIQLAKTSLNMRHPFRLNNMELGIAKDYTGQLVNVKLVGNLSENCCVLVSKNAQTLKALFLVYLTSNPVSFPKLITNRDGGSIVYPNLQKLEICFSTHKGDHDNTQYPTFPKDFVPFPNLQQLKLCSGFLFGDDVLLRGNHYTLKHFILGMDADSARFLFGLSVFSTGKYKKLERVQLKLLGSPEDDSTVNKYVRVVTDIGRYAKYLRYGDSKHNHQVGKPMAASFCHNLQHIERLNLGHIKFEFVDVFKMIKMLTHLQELRIKGFLSTGLPQKMSLSQMLSTYQMINSSLKVLYVENRRHLPRYGVALQLALLVILCPELMRIWMNGEWLAKEWSKILKRKGFEVYRQRLEQVQVDNAPTGIFGWEIFPCPRALAGGGYLFEYI